MLPAFRVKGLWPKPRGISKSDGTHPLTGALLPKFENTEAILQLPLDKYDELVASNPEYRLKYLDEDKDEITIGSEMELATKLDEPTSHSRLVRRSEDPRFYTSIPECMHAFHINDDDEARKLWTFFESSTISRNHAAHKLWTSPKIDSAQDVQALLNEHAYEFMTGYNFEGFNSHYNYLSKAGQQIKVLAAKRDPSAQESMVNALPAASRIVEIPAQKTEPLPPQPIGPRQAAFEAMLSQPQNLNKFWTLQDLGTAGLYSYMEKYGALERSDTKSPEIPTCATKVPERVPESPIWTANSPEKMPTEVTRNTAEVHDSSSANKSSKKMQHTGSSDTFALTHAKVSKSMASLNDELDKHLETAQALTRMLDQNTSSQNDFVNQSLLQDRFDRHFELAQGATRVMDTVRKNRQPLLAIPSQAPIIEAGGQQKGNASIVTPSPPLSLDIGFAKYAPPYTNHKSSDKTDLKELDNSPQDRSPGVSPPQEHLTDLGMKDSREAGLKLRNQLYGTPKPCTGVAHDDVYRCVLRASNPPQFQSPTDVKQIAEPTPQQVSANETVSLNKKKSVRFSFPSYARGEWHLDGSFSPGSRVAEPLVVAEKTAGLLPPAQRDMTATEDQEFGPKTDVLPTNSKSKNSTSTSIAGDDLVKIRELLKVFDEYSGESTATMARRYRTNLKAKGITLEEVRLPSVGKTLTRNPEPQVTARQTSHKAGTDSVETTITKLWYQACEGIMSNIDTFTEQLNTHVKAQISWEQATLSGLLAQEPPSGPLENDQTFLDNAKHAKDLITLQDSVQQMIVRLRNWNTASKKYLAQTELGDGYKINVDGVYNAIEGLGQLSSVADNSFRDIFQAFLATSERSFIKDNESMLESHGTREDTCAKPCLRWVPRRYSSKIDSRDRVPELDKANNKQPFSDSAAGAHGRRYSDHLPSQDPALFWKKQTAEQSANANTNVTKQIGSQNADANTLKRNPSLDNHTAQRCSPAATVFAHKPSNHSRTNLYKFNNNVDGQLPKDIQPQVTKPESTETGSEPSDTLLQNFPPLIPRREPQQYQNDPARNMTYKPFQYGPPKVVHPNLDRAGLTGNWPFVPPPLSIEIESTATQRPNTLPGRERNSSRHQHDSALTQQLNMVPRHTLQPHPTFRMVSEDSRSTMSDPKALRPTVIPQGNTSDNTSQSRRASEPLNEGLRKAETYGTWSDDALLPAALSSPTWDTSARKPSVSDRPKSAPPADMFQLYQDIPEHRDPRTAVKIMNCVEKLKDMGCGNRVDGGDARLVVYAQAAGGNLEAALDIMEEERQAYAEHKDHVDSYYD